MRMRTRSRQRTSSVCSITCWYQTWRLLVIQMVRTCFLTGDEVNSEISNKNFLFFYDATKSDASEILWKGKKVLFVSRQFRVRISIRGKLAVNSCCVKERHHPLGLRSSANFSDQAICCIEMWKIVHERSHFIHAISVECWSWKIRLKSAWKSDKWFWDTRSYTCI